MKPFILVFLLATFIYPVFAGYPTSHWSKDQDARIKDTIPEMCSILPGWEIDTLHVFTNRLTKTFPDPNAGENYWGCYYQFYKPDDYPQLAIRMIKWGSKQEAADDFRMQVSSAVRINGIAPERLYGVADSA